MPPPIFIRKEILVPRSSICISKDLNLVIPDFDTKSYQNLRPGYDQSTLIPDKTFDSKKTEDKEDSLLTDSEASQIQSAHMPKIDEKVEEEEEEKFMSERIDSSVSNAEKSGKEDMLSSNSKEDEEKENEGLLENAKSRIAGEE